MKNRVVQPRDFKGWSMSLHPGGPKFTIVCGGCGCGFRKRLIKGISYPKVGCPTCGAINELTLVWGK